MPQFKTQQQRAAFAVAAKDPEKSRSGIPQAVAKRAMAEDKGGKLPSKAQRGAAMAEARVRALRRRRAAQEQHEAGEGSYNEARERMR